jgi:osmoprotectant transport system ATP-binding protein
MEVEFRDVSYDVGGRSVLRGLNLRLQRGETVVLLGRSGAGKTTALRMVNALVFPGAGEVLVDGKPTTAWDPIALRRRTGYAIQETGLFPHMTVAENIGIVPRLQGTPKDRTRQRVRSLLEEVQLPPAEFEARYPRELSGGQRQRAGVARALAGDPDLLLFDEPFGALDPLTRLELQRQYLDIQRRHPRTALFVTHDVSEAVRLGTRIGLMHEGRIVALASPEEFRRLSQPLVRTFLSCLET